jgi:hypothetical protein
MGTAGEASVTIAAGMKRMAACLAHRDREAATQEEKRNY